MMNSMNPCCCCLLRLPEKDLQTPYIRLGATEIYADMLEDCFQIQLAINEEDWGICSECVRRLRDASDFKQQVQCSQDKLRARLELRHVKKEPECEDSKMSDDVVYNEDISIEIMPTSILESESEPPEAMEKQMSCSESHFNVGARCVESSKCESFESQFTLFCLNSDKQTERKSKTKRREQTNGPYSCVMCPTVLATKALLVEHKRTHKIKSHTCHICNKIFKQKCKLLDHIRKHNGQKPFSCKICNKQFTSNSILWTHNLRHRGLAFACDTCGKSYTQRRDLVAHIKVHSDNMFKCELCGLQFVYKHVLRAHQAVHSEIKQFTCDVCRKQFRRKDHLATHNLTHSGEKPHACGICDQKFTTKSNVKKHIKKIHGLKNQ